MNEYTTTILKAIRDGIVGAVADLASVLVKVTSIDNKFVDPLPVAEQNLPVPVEEQNLPLPVAEQNLPVPSQLSLAYVVPYTASTADLQTLVGGPCDGVQVTTDDYSIAFAGPNGPDTYPNQTVAAPSAIGAGWTDNGDGTYTHTAGGGVAPLEWTGKLTVGARVLAKYTLGGVTAGTLTGAAGTTAGAASAADGAVRELLVTAGTQTYSLTPTDPFDGTVSLVEVLPTSPPLKAAVMSDIQCRRIEAVIDDTGAEVAAGTPAAVLTLGWYVKP